MQIDHVFIRTTPGAPEAEALLEITFDHAARGLRHDFRPALPLVFNY